MMSPPEPPSPAPEPAPSAIDLLVVEDDRDLSEVYRRILSRFGPVRECADLAGALRAIQQKVPQVVILDLGLPDSQGLDGLARIRRTAPGTAVVITTGASDETTALEALRSGAQDYLLKGRLEASTLVRAVRYALERKSAENKLRRSEELFSVITGNMIDLLSIIDARGARLYTSPSYQKLLGYTDAEMAELDLQDLVHPDDRGMIRQALARLFSEGSSQGLEYRARHKDGSYRVFESNAACIRDTQSGEPQAVFVARDITARKRAEAEHALMEIQLRQAQKLESIGQLAAGIAHEINTPVQFISDNLRFLEEAFRDLGEVFQREGAFVQRALPDSGLSAEAGALAEWVAAQDTAYLLEEIPKALQQSMEGVKRVATIIQAMKAFSHPGTEGRSAVDLNRALENTALVARSEWKYVAELDLDLDPDLPIVDVFPGEINQAFLNLIVNAAHAIEERVGNTGAKGLIRVRTRSEGEWAEIRVQDTGCGIPESIRPRIFDPFFTTRAVGKGTGQGLSIVHSAVTRHGGTLRFETEVGQGTTFILRLPVRAPVP